MNMIRRAEDGYIFYDHLQKKDKQLYDEAKEAFETVDDMDSIEGSFNPQEIANNLYNIAYREREKEVRYLRDNFNVTLSDELTAADTKNLITYFNEQFNIGKTWEVILDRLRLVQEKSNSEYGERIDPRNLIAERFAYQVEVFFNKRGNSFINKMFKIPAVRQECQSAFAEAYTADDSKALQVNLEYALKRAMNNQEVQALWEAFATEAAIYASEHIGDQYKISNQNQQIWEQIGKDINSNIALQQGLAYSFGGQLTNISVLKNIAGNIAKGLAKGAQLTDQDIRRGNKSSVYKNAVSRAKTQLKHSVFGKGDTRAKKRGLLAEGVLSAVAIALEEKGKGKNDIHIEVAASKTMRTGEVSTVFSTDSLYISFEFPTKEVIQNFVQSSLSAKNDGKGKKSNTFVWDKTKTAEAIAEVEKQVFASQKANSAIIYESTKDYNITSTFSKRGFQGTSMNYTSAITVLSSLLHKDTGTIQLYLNKLLNSMTGAMYGESFDRNKANDFLTYSLASQVGAMLFDDMYATTAGLMNDNRGIHIFRLSGIVIPLSVFLMGFARAFDNWNDGTSRAYARKWFKVGFTRPSQILYKYNSSTDSYDYEGQHPAEAWNTQRKYAINRFKITMSFFGTFIEEVLKYFPT